MATKTEEQIGTLRLQVTQLSAEVSERNRRSETDINSLQKTVIDLETRIRSLETELATTKQKTAELDKRADRSWSLTQALIVVAITALVSALTQLSIKR